MSANLKSEHVKWTVPSQSGLSAVEVLVSDPGRTKSIKLPSEVSIRASGQFLDKNAIANNSGILALLRNAPQRGHVWKFKISTFRHTKHNVFALADERGQVFIFDCDNNSYSIVRTASRPVTSLCFAESRKNDLIIAYESGSQIIVDVASKDVVTIVQSLPHANQPITLTRSHPKKPLIINLHGDKVISLWDLSEGKNLGNIQTDETVIDATFEMNGEFIAIVLEYTGILWYHTSSLQVALKCELPSSERRPKWKAYCACSVRAMTLDGQSQALLFLCGENGSLYTWRLAIQKLTHGKSAIPHKTIDCFLISVTELPSKIGEVSQLISVSGAVPYETNTTTASRLLLSTIDGDVFFIDITGIEALHSVGKYMVTSSLSHFNLNGQDVTESPQIGRCVAAQGNLAVFVSRDGGARLIDIANSIGNGLLVGKVLQPRPPKPEDKQDAMPPQSQNRSLSKSNVNRKLVLNKQQTKESGALVSLLNIPLFELSKLTAEEKRLNTFKLKSFYTHHGCFPARYRPLIWRFLLRLPENSEAFTHLVQRGMHPAFEDLYSTFPLQSRKVFSRLQSICSTLSHWSYVCAEMTYLPQLVFPFVLVFESDDLAAFETTMTILMLWGYTWCATLPHPPSHILHTLSSLLHLHDRSLYDHLENRLKISCGSLLWQMMSSLFTEVLGKEDWLRAMDYLMLNFSDPEHLLLMTIAIVKSCKVALLVMSVDEDVFAYLRTQQGFNIQEIVKLVQSMLKTSPKKYFVGGIPGCRSSDENDQNCQSDAAEARNALCMSGGQPVFPLPKGRYPAYRGYPKAIIDWQIKQREKILAMNSELKRKDKVLAQIQAEISALEISHEDFMQRYQAASDEQLAYYRDSMAAESKHLAQLQLIEEEISSHRLKALQLTERSANEELALTQKMAQDARQLLQEKEAHLKRKTEQSASLYKTRELNEVAAMKSIEKQRRMEIHRAREEALKSIAATIDAKEQEFIVEDALLEGRWKDEDLRRPSSSANLMDDDSRGGDRLDSMQAELQARLKALEASRAAKIAEIEKARSIRSERARSSSPMISASHNVESGRIDSDDSEDEDDFRPLQDAVTKVQASRVLRTSQGSSSESRSSSMSLGKLTGSARTGLDVSSWSGSGSTYSDLKSLATDSLRALLREKSY